MRLSIWKNGVLTLFALTYAFLSLGQQSNTDITFKAEIRGAQTIWAFIDAQQRSLNPEDYKITDGSGKEIKVAGVMPNTATETLILPAEELDIRRVYFLEIPNQNLKTFCSFDGWFRNIYSNKELGATVSDNKSNTVFRIFAPRASTVKVYLYKNAEDKKAYKTLDLVADINRVWEVQLEENLHGTYYDYSIHGANDPGNHFFETINQHVSDPYARVNMDAWGKSRVWEKTSPAQPLANGIPPMEDVIAYEVHIQDFTDLLPVSNDMKGTIPAMYQKGLKNSKGKKIGFDYVVDLGVNVVHLMPMQEYIHFNKEDWKTSFEHDPYMKAQGINEENYQWGYRTTHCFAVEGSYRQKNTEPGEERNQFRDLVQAFHQEDIAVIIDIVPNHTGENMDGNQWYFNFNGIDKMYYYRTKDFNHIGAFGNEVKTENRPMTQRWLIDQCLHFINEFGVDGFRIDLAGQVDQQTLIALKEAIGHDKILYGEPWIGSNDPEFEANPDWDWYKADAPITFFQDEARNAFKGTVFDLNTKKYDRGYAGGNEGERDNVIKGLTCTFSDDKTPNSGINYLDIHDNWALADQFATEDWLATKAGVDENRLKIAATLLYTSVGPIVNHGGTEMLRSKDLAPTKEIKKTTKAGVNVYIHGHRDSYNLRNANHFVWENLGAKGADAYADFTGMYQFWQGLNTLRKSEYGKVFRTGETIPKDYYQFITPQNKYLLGYIANETVFVLVNTEDKENSFENITLPTGDWKLIGDINHINIKGIKGTKQFKNIKGGKNITIPMSKESIYIWIKK